jgi:hypothetical protein
MTEDSTVREHLHEAVQSTIQMDEEMPEGAMLRGWAVVAEWVAPDNRAWITYINGGADGEGLAEWQSDGLLHHALYRMAAVPDDEDDN